MFVPERVTQRNVECDWLQILIQQPSGVWLIFFLQQPMPRGLLRRGAIRSPVNDIHIYIRSENFGDSSSSWGTFPRGGGAFPLAREGGRRPTSRIFHLRRVLPPPGIM